MEEPKAQPGIFLPTENFLLQVEERVVTVIGRAIQPLLEKLSEEKLLSPMETVKLFDPPISKQTLHNWQRKGLLRKHYIGGRTFYKRSEVLEAAKSLKKYQ
jgi:hypothetical protein